MQIEKANHIHAALLAQGMSCRSWAIENGYKPRTVQKYIQWFAPDTGRRPKRKLANSIMSDLSKTIGVQLLGGENDY
ncbi:hypothetical protein [uncultured Shewanella sp.]|uniref:hypothetical protein n=1 Tax=uncultured Shewanella sp. TaxID=173975 RepID=UPI002621AB7F|nr:hypothetical protein [uncultured Shewanella sp.]